MLTIRGGNRIFGDISLSGAKNAALPLLAAACLCSETVMLRNMPVELIDVQVMISVLRTLGYEIHVEDHAVTVREPGAVRPASEVPAQAGRIRYSLLLLPLLLSRTGRVDAPIPGGCPLGDRKHDIHIDSLRRLGAVMEEGNGRIAGRLTGGFTGGELLFHTATTSGSESAVLAAVLAKGATVIKNANTRPEVVDMLRFLRQMGADVRWGTRYIEVRGVNRLRGGEYTVMQDGHEAVSYMILAAMLRSEIRIRDFSPALIAEDTALLRRIGADIFTWGGSVYVSAKGKALRPFSMATAPYPGINSDMQPLLAALACTIEGESIITDTRFAQRFQYVEEFRKFGLDIVNYENCAVIHGAREARGAHVHAPDLRAGAALTFLGCWAQGTTVIDNDSQTERGYVGIVEKLRALGVADIQKKTGP